MLYCLFLVVVILEAVEDGLWERGNKEWSKRVEGNYKALLLLFPCFLTRDVWVSHTFWDVAKYMITIGVLWASIRAYLFDPVMHLISGFDTDHVGITSPLWNKLMKKLSDWRVWVWRGFWLAFSLFWFVMVIKRY